LEVRWFSLARSSKVISEREHFEALLEQMELRYEQRFQAQNSAIQAALLSTKEAISKSDAAVEKRFDSVNEFRGQLNDQTKTFASVEKVDAVIQRIDRMEGKSIGYSSMYGWLAALAGIAIAAAALFLK
jgi:hypothetical protein